MTCIAAITNGKTVWMGADSIAANTNFNCNIRLDKKVFMVEQYIIGFTTSFRMGDLLKWSLIPPKITKEDDNIEKFMATKFINSVIKLFDDNGFAKSTNNQKEGGEFLVGIRGKIFHVYSDYQIGLNKSNFDSCGCGSDLAIGSLYTTHKIGNLSPEKRIKISLEAASYGSCGVKPPYTILKI